MKRNTRLLLLAVSLCGLSYHVRAAIPKVDEVAILRVSCAYLEALRANDLAKLKSLSDPRSVSLKSLNDKDYGRRFMYIDYWRQSLRLKNQTNPVDPAILRINKTAKWRMVNQLIMFPDTVVEYPKLSPSNCALVEVDYLKGHPPVLLPVTKVDKGWYVGNMPKYSTAILRYRSFYEATIIPNGLPKDAFSIDDSVYIPETPQGYTPPKSSYNSFEDFKAACRVVAQFLEALRINDISKMTELTDTNAIFGRNIKSTNVVFRRGYLDYWRKMMRLDNRRTPVDPTMVIASLGKAKMLIDIVKAGYNDGDTPTALSKENATVTGYCDMECMGAFIPVRKVNDQWLVVGISDWSSMVLSKKSLDDAKKDPEVMYLKLKKPDPKLVCPVDDKASK